MSHNINEERVFTVGGNWHGLGNIVSEALTAKEAIKETRMDFEVEKQPIFTANKEIKDKVAIVRTDNQDVLGITTPKYKIIQNVEAFSFFDTVVGEGQAIYHSAGVLGKGERIWILAKLPNDIVLGAEDKIEKYLCLTTTHDGKNSLRAYFTPVRVVCQNTLNQSMSDAKNGISIRHFGNIMHKVDEAREILGISIDFYKQFEQITNELEATVLTVDETDTYFKKVLNIDGKNQDDISTRKENQFAELVNLFENGKGQKLGNKHSAWKAYNAVTEYVDHHSVVRGLKEDKSRKLGSIWFGSGAKLKERAYEEALALL